MASPSNKSYSFVHVSKLGKVSTALICTYGFESKIAYGFSERETCVCESQVTGADIMIGRDVITIDGGCAAWAKALPELVVIEPHCLKIGYNRIHVRLGNV